MANTASASAITTRPGPGATKSTTPTARITVPTTVTAIRRSSLTGSFTSASMPSAPPVLPRDRGPVGECPHLVGYLRVHRGRQVMPDPGQDDEPGTPDRRGGAPRGGRAQQRILLAVQDQGWHAGLGQPTTVPFRASLTALRRGVADAADLVPFGHPAHFLLVDGIGR